MLFLIVLNVVLWAGALIVFKTWGPLYGILYWLGIGLAMGMFVVWEDIRRTCEINYPYGDDSGLLGIGRWMFWVTHGGRKARQEWHQRWGR